MKLGVSNNVTGVACAPGRGQVSESPRICAAANSCKLRSERAICASDRADAPMRDPFERAASFGYPIGTGLAMVLIVVIPGRSSVVERLPVLAMGLVFILIKTPIAAGRRKRGRDDSAQ